MRLKQGYIKDGIGHIPLTQGKEALVDAHNFAWLSQWNWCAARDKHGRWYAVRNVTQTVQLKLHRLIMDVTDPKIEIDHIDRTPEGGLDNREANLRFASHSQNVCNTGLTAANTSGFKGPLFERGKWRVRVRHNGQRASFGVFNTAVEAAAVYNFVAKRLHGEFAVLNDLSQVTEAQLEAA